MIWLTISGGAELRGLCDGNTQRPRSRSDGVPSFGRHFLSAAVRQRLHFRTIEPCQVNHRACGYVLRTKHFVRAPNQAGDGAL